MCYIILMKILFFLLKLLIGGVGGKLLFEQVVHNITTPPPHTHSGVKQKSLCNEYLETLHRLIYHQQINDSSYPANVIFWQYYGFAENI